MVRVESSRVGDAGDAEEMVEHFDVLIVGAGISGVAAAYHLQEQCPERSFVVLEAYETFGGTWFMHRYPGIRSDSDLYTFGYRFKPWTGPPIATGPEILKYMNEVIAENDLDRHIRYRHRVAAANWSSATNLWSIDAARTDENGNETAVRFTTNFLWMCQGYYRHAQGYTPDWPGMTDFGGTIVHPQTWPEDLDLDGKRVVCIGSGATTATVVPAIAAQCEHVTVLQRSPTYFWTGKNTNEIADTLRELDIDETWIHEIVRRKILHDQEAVTKLSFEEPEFLKELLIGDVKNHLPEGYDVETHFTPRYRPWQQRLAFVPDADLFEGIKSGKASMVTDEIDHFTERGIALRSGQELEADVIITATGFELSVLGGIPFTVDGRAVDFAETVTWRGMMFTGVPNLLWVFGYFRASWTLRAELICDLVCLLLHHMDELGAHTVTPELRGDADADLVIGPWMDADNFNPGYLQRSMHLMPKAGNKPEWRHTQDYWREREDLPSVDLDDGCLVYE